MNSKQTPVRKKVHSDSGSAPIETSQSNGTESNVEARRRRTAIAAFYRAEARGFAPGRELEDWLEAEREVDALEAARHEIATSQPDNPAGDPARAEDGAGPAHKRAASKRVRTKTTKTTKTTRGAALQTRNRGDET